MSDDKKLFSWVPVANGEEPRPDALPSEEGVKRDMHLMDYYRASVRENESLCVNPHNATKLWEAAWHCGYQYRDHLVESLRSRVRVLDERIDVADDNLERLRDTLKERDAEIKNLTEQLANKGIKRLGRKR